ncbi:putative Zn-dependent peptidase [Metabacillus crassostreae]|uniref:YtzH-like family protein n=1 Tax=Metabacillus crassostreae TaxID=929098 RepID=UPI001958A723|nr:YtzH-like family protein [Metabacillus crassostreae]MBM7606133.1 putative Zn-dependent peptidase [Metabacillus crassostreae]
MPIQYHDQVNLLKDILSEHQSECCGTVAECEQLERVIKSLMVNSNTNPNVKNMLEDIYTYSQSGKNSTELNQHIQSHQEQLSQWVEDINTYS